MAPASGSARRRSRTTRFARKGASARRPREAVLLHARRARRRPSLAGACRLARARPSRYHRTVTAGGKAAHNPREARKSSRRIEPWSR